MKNTPKLEYILLVDDDDSNNFLHTILIKELGLNVKVEVAENGIEALEFLTCTGKFSANTINDQSGLILLDINMPLMTGWEFLEEFKQLSVKQKGKTFITMVTSSLNEVDVERAKADSDVLSFTSKPLNADMINKVIMKHF